MAVRKTAAKKASAKKKPSKTKKTQPKPEMGRPTRYQDEYVEQARRLCLLGATDSELAEFFNVDTRTVYRWKNQHEDFCHAVSVGKDMADERVERSLYNRACGYTYDTEKVFQFQGQIVRAKTTEHVPPDTGAAFNWLKNRRPDEWRDRKEVDVRDKTHEDALTELEEEVAAAGPAHEQLH